MRTLEHLRSDLVAAVNQRSSPGTLASGTVLRQLKSWEEAESVRDGKDGTHEQMQHFEHQLSDGIEGAKDTLSHKDA